MKVGDKIRGFKFKSNQYFGFNSMMNDYIGEIGIIDDIIHFNNSILVNFYHQDGDIKEFWYYPLDEAAKHLVIESNDLFPIY